MTAPLDDVANHYKMNDGLGNRCGWCGYTWPCWRVARAMIEKARAGLQEIRERYPAATLTVDETAKALDEMETGAKP